MLQNPTAPRVWSKIEIVLDWRKSLTGVKRFLANMLYVTVLMLPVALAVFAVSVVRTSLFAGETLSIEAHWWFYLLSSLFIVGIGIVEILGLRWVDRALDRATEHVISEKMVGGDNAFRSQLGRDVVKGIWGQDMPLERDSVNGAILK